VFRHNRNRRIESKPGEPLSNVYLWLTHDEAGELRDTIDQMMRDGDSGWHGHVPSADYQTEITVALDRA
jgi:hypothetical protein